MGAFVDPNVIKGANPIHSILPYSAVSCRFAIPFSDKDSRSRVVFSCQSLCKLWVHNGVRLEAVHDPSRWAGVEEGTRGTILDLTEWSGKPTNRISEDPEDPCCSLIAVV